MLSRPATGCVQCNQDSDLHPRRRCPSTLQQGFDSRDENTAVTPEYSVLTLRLVTVYARL
jgi:hypothetical protein